MVSIFIVSYLTELLLILTKLLLLNKRYCLILLLIGFGFYTGKSQNLIRNSGFDNFVNLHLPSYYGKFWAYNPSYIQIVNDWQTINSPDHFDTAFIPGGYHVPYSRFGNAYSKIGSSFAGIAVFDIRFDYQEYPYQFLTNPLKKDSIYCLSFFTTRADRLPFAIKSLGASFSISTPTLSGGYINALPQVVNTTGFLTDTVNWVEIKGCFTAQGGEQYITIGNFNSNANTDTLRIPSTNPLTGTGTDVAYYYIDSVTLWQNNFPTAINEFNKENEFSVYPNPTLGKLKLLCQNLKDIEHCVVKITDVLGREVKQLKFEDEIDITELEKGIYFLSVYKSKTLVGTKKIVRE